MSEHIQPLLDRIHTEGLKKAEAEREALLEKAREEARQIRNEAEQEAETLRKQAETDAEATRARGQTALEQAARDTLLQFRAELNRQLQRIAKTAAKETLSAADVISALLKNRLAAKSDAANVTLEAGSDLAQELETLLPALLRELGSSANTEIVLNPKTGAGFKLQFADSAAVADFTDESIAAWLSTHLRPELAKTLQPQAGA